MNRFICVTCGTQFAETEVPPPCCPICSDERQFVGWNGQAWTTHAELRTRHALRFTPETDEVTSIAIEPHFGIGQRALLVRNGAKNVLWDCLALVDDKAIAEIKALGGLDAIAISHPHYYTAMVEWSEAFGSVPIYLHEQDRQWVMHPHKAIMHWSGDRHELAPGLTLIRCGGHFDGATVMHWAQGDDGEGALFSGDVIAVNQDRATLSFMYSFPNYIPLNAAAVSGIAAVMAPYRFETIFGAFPGRNLRRGGRAAFEHSIARYLKAVAS